MPKFIVSLLLFCAVAIQANAQAVLPDFTVKNNKELNSVCWQNEYDIPIKAISVQRSYDSVKGFTSIFTVINPALPANGFLDGSTYYPKMFYRLFISFDSGAYVFTPAKQPIIDADFDYLKAVRQIWKEKGVQMNAEPKTTQANNFIYTGRENNIIINLPGFRLNRYIVKIFEDNDDLLFDLKNLKEGYLIIDKANFLHSGQFYFEVYDEGKLIQKNKFYIPRD